MGTSFRPEPFDHDAFLRQYGPQSEIAQQEWANFERMRQEAFDSLVSRLGLMQRTGGIADSTEAFDVASLLPPDATENFESSGLFDGIGDFFRNNVLEPVGQFGLDNPIGRRVAEGLLLIDPPENVLSERRERLMSAARYWNIEGAEELPDDQLDALIQSRRISSAKGSMDVNAAQQFGIEMGVFLPEALSSALESIESLPFVGRDLGRIINVNEAQDWLRTFSEGMKGSLPPEYLEDTLRLGTEGFGADFSKLDVISGSGMLAGWLVPGVGAWKAAGYAGKATGAARLINRSGVIRRSALLSQGLSKFAQGSSATWMLVGGGNKPVEEKRLEVLLGGALDAGLEVGLPFLWAGMSKGFANMMNRVSRKYGSKLVRHPGLEPEPYFDPGVEEADWSFGGMDEVVPSAPTAAAADYTVLSEAPSLLQSGQRLLPPGPPPALGSGLPPVLRAPNGPASLSTPSPVRGLLPAGGEYWTVSPTAVQHSNVLSAATAAVGEPYGPGSRSMSYLQMASKNRTLPSHIQDRYEAWVLRDRSTSSSTTLDDWIEILREADNMAQEAQAYARKSAGGATGSYAQQLTDRLGTVVRDDNGQPALMYHGTGYPGELNEMMLMNDPEGNLFGPGLYNTTSPPVASSYAMSRLPDEGEINHWQTTLNQIETDPQAVVAREVDLVENDLARYYSDLEAADMGLIEMYEGLPQEISNLEQRLVDLQERPMDYIEGVRRAAKSELETLISNKPNIRAHYLALQRPLKLDVPIDFDEAEFLLKAASDRFPEWNPAWQEIADHLQTVRRSPPTQYRDLGLEYDQTQNLSMTEVYNAMTYATDPVTHQRFTKSRMTALLMSLGYDGIHHRGGIRVGGLGEHDVFIAWYPESIIPAYLPPPMPGRVARAEADALTKHNQVINSPAVSELAAKSSLTDADVVHAVADNNPGGTSIVRNISLTAETLDELMKKQGPLHWEYVDSPEGTFDLLVSRAPIPSSQVTEYKATGLFTGMHVSTASGKMGIVKTPSSGTVVLQHPVYPNLTFKVRRKNVMPSTNGVPIVNAGGLYKDFRNMVEGYMARESEQMGIATPNWLDMETSSQLPYLMDQFFDSKGIDQIQRDAIEQDFNSRRIRDFAELAPEEIAIAAQEWERAERASYYGSFEGGGPDVFDKAAAKGFIWVTQPGTAHGTLHDQFSSMKVPLEDEGAADEFLSAFEREVADGTPVMDVPPEVAPGMDFGNDIPKAGTEESFVEDLADEVEFLQQEVEFFSPEPVDEVEEFIRRVGGGGRDIPPPPPPVGPPGAAGPSPLGSGDRAVNMYRVDDLTDLIDKYTGLVARGIRNTRNYFQRMEEDFAKRGVDFKVWSAFEEVEAGLQKTTAEVYPWSLRLREIFKRIRHKHLRSGDFQRIAEIRTYPDRIHEARRVGFNDKEIQALDDYELFHKDFDEHLFGEAPRGSERYRRMLSFSSYVRSQQGLKTGDPYFDNGILGHEYQWVRKMFKNNTLAMRQMDARVLTTLYVRGAFFERNVAKPLDAFNRLGRLNGVDPHVTKIMNDWSRIITRGYDVQRSKVVRGVHAVLTKHLGFSKSETAELVNGLLGWTHMGALGYRTHVLFRDLIQPIFAAAKGSSRVLGRVYKDYAGNPAERDAMVQRAIDGGWVEVGHAPIDTPYPEETLRFGETHNQFVSELGPLRKAVRGKVLTLMDMFGNRVDLHGPWGPLGPYSKMGGFNRIMSGEMGYRLATRANDKLMAWNRIRAGIGTDADRSLVGKHDYTKEQWLADSRLRTMNPVVGDKAWHLASSGRFEDAAKLGAREFAFESQFMYGVRNLPPTARSMDGRMGYQFGTYTLQLSTMLENGARYGTLADKVKFFGVMGATAMGLKVLEEKTGWNFSDWIWYKALGWMGGPIIDTAIELYEAAGGAIAEHMGEPVSPLQETAGQMLENKIEDLSVQGSFLNPLRGGMATVEAYGQVPGALSPWEALARTTITGDVGAVVDFERMLKEYGAEQQQWIGVPLQQQPPPAGAGGR